MKSLGRGRRQARQEGEHIYGKKPTLSATRGTDQLATWSQEEYGQPGLQRMYLKLKSLQRMTETWALLERGMAQVKPVHGERHHLLRGRFRSLSIVTRAHAAQGLFKGEGLQAWLSGARPLRVRRAARPRGEGEASTEEAVEGGRIGPMMCCQLNGEITAVSRASAGRDGL